MKGLFVGARANWLLLLVDLTLEDAYPGFCSETARGNIRGLHPFNRLDRTKAPLLRMSLLATMIHVFVFRVLAISFADNEAIE